MKASALIAVAVSMAAVAGARVRGGGREQRALSVSAATERWSSWCDACTPPRKYKVYKCPAADTDDATYSSCSWILQKKDNGAFSKAWSIGRAFTFSCNPDPARERAVVMTAIQQKTSTAHVTYRGVHVEYAADGGKYSFAGYMPHTGMLKVKDGVVTVPIFEKIGHHEGDLEIKVLATRKGHTAAADDFATWLGAFVAACTGDPTEGGIAVEPVPVKAPAKISTAEATKLSRHAAWKALYNDALRSAMNKRGPPLQTRDGFLSTYFTTSVSFNCDRDAGAPPLPKYRSLLDLAGRMDDEVASNMHQALLAAKIPPSATKADIATYILDMLEFPESGTRQEVSVSILSEDSFQEWLALNGCRR